MSLPFESIKREIIVKKEANTDKRISCRPEERDVEELINYGIINLNKPAGPTSHQISDFVKKILHINKAGHSGTLDPGVTGVLPIATGNATRIVQGLLTAGKEYVCLMYLHKPIEESLIRKTMQGFIGEITQLPPVKSAVKRQWRKRNIYSLEIIEIEGQEVLFRMGCQAGTYVRKFVHDFGLKLGIGAHMAELVRTKVASFTDKDMVTLHDLKDAYTLWKESGRKDCIKKCIQPMERAVEHLPKVWLLDTTVDTLAHGASLSVPGITKLHSGIQRGDLVAVMTLKEELVCIGQALMSSEDIEKSEKGLAVKNWKVFMKPDIYPKFIRKKEQTENKEE
ncbi:MAG: RNA-guided pseudouridylation complex pseudouridine synthase subunit Cbf5 [Candidatus Nanoarchaeia archaeon]|nr:RNA-guided pseudouridylation complex pseudouridine synthase subunit Cbf5 [Candidatus Nanoarchaeia archaeon]